MVNGNDEWKMGNGVWYVVNGKCICKEIATNSYKCPSTCQASKKQATEKNQMSTIFGE